MIANPIRLVSAIAQGFKIILCISSNIIKDSRQLYRFQTYTESADFKLTFLKLRHFEGYGNGSSYIVTKDLESLGRI